MSTSPGWRHFIHPGSGLSHPYHHAASRDYQDLLGYARPALQTACEAGSAGFISTWRAETGTEPRDWLARPDSAPGT